MNKKLFLLLGIFFILLSGFVNSYDFTNIDTNIYAYYTSDNVVSDSVNGYNLTSVNGGFRTGKINQSFDMDGSTSYYKYVDGGSDVFDVGSRNISISFWVYPDAVTNTYILGKKEAISSGWFVYSASTGALQVGFRSSSINCYINTATGVLTSGSWQNFMIVRNVSANKVTLYKNNVSVGSVTNVECSANADNIEDFNIGTVANGATGLNGGVDEFAFFDGYAFSLNDISSLYYAGNNNMQYPFGSTPTISNFSITAKSNYSGVSISNFSVDIDGGVLSTVNGSINSGLLQNDTSLHNITFFGDWFNKSYGDYNVSSDLEGELFQSNTTFNFKFSSGDFVSTSINVTDLGNGLFFNVSGGVLSFNPDADNLTFSVRCNNSVFAPFNFSLDIDVLSVNNLTFVVNETPSILTFYDANSGLPISGGVVEVFYPSGVTSNMTTNSSGSVVFSYIFNNSLEFGTYNFSFSKLGFVTFNFSEVINSSTVPFSADYNMSRANLTINVYNRSNGVLLNGVNVTINFVGLFNETISNGTLIKNNLSIVGDEYSIFVSANGYRTEKRVFSFTNQENLEIDFYLLSLSDPNIGVVSATTSDNYFRKLSGLPVDLLEYDSDDLSFISVSQCITNINGECDFVIELNTKIYYLQAVRINDDGDVEIANTGTDGEIFTSTGEVRNLIFQLDLDFVVSGVGNLIYDVSESFVDNVSSISVNFINGDGTNVEVCVEYFIKVGSDYVSVTGDTYCLVSSSAVQNIDVDVTLNRSNNYKAEVYIKEGDGNIPLDRFVYPSIFSADEVFTDDFISALIVLLWLCALALALHGKNVTMWFVFAIILSWLEVLIFPSFSIVAISVFKTVISLFTMMISRKPKDFD